jgi:hypothetical protein
VFNGQAFNQLIELHLLSSVEEAALMKALPFKPSDHLIFELYAMRLNRVRLSRWL